MHQTQELLWELLDASQCVWWWKHQNSLVTEVSVMDCGGPCTGPSPGRGRRYSGAAENWRRPCSALKGKCGQESRKGRNSCLWVESQAKKRKAAWKRWLFRLSKHLSIYGSFSMNPSLQRETACHIVWILIIHTFPCKQKHTGIFRALWYLEMNKWEP